MAKRKKRSTKRRSKKNSGLIAGLLPKNKLFRYAIIILLGGSIAGGTLSNDVFNTLDRYSGGWLRYVRNYLPIEQIIPSGTGASEGIATEGLGEMPEGEAIALPAFQPGDQVIRHKHYTLKYDETHEQAAWVAYKLEARETRGGAERQDDFRTDPKVRTESASPEDYRGSGYDRGHIAPAADFKFSAEAMSESFFMSNMSPQAPDFNRGIWRELEEQVREWVQKDKAYYVVCGPVLQSGLRKIGRDNKVSVPKQYFKILLDLEEPGIKAIAFLMNNEGSDKPFQSFVVSIDEVEQLTGIDFFESLDDALEQKLESQKMPEAWFK